MMKNKPTWQQIDSKTIFQNKWISLYQDTVLTPAGKEGEYAYIDVKPFVAVAAVVDDSILMIRQSRYPLNADVWEIPAGGIEANEDALTAAKRELLEETGTVAKVWKSLGEFYQISSVSRQKGHLFIAMDLEHKSRPALDDELILHCKSFTFLELKQQIAHNEMVDNLTAATLLRVQLYLDSQSPSYLHNQLQLD